MNSYGFLRIVEFIIINKKQNKTNTIKCECLRNHINPKNDNGLLTMPPLFFAFCNADIAPDASATPPSTAAYAKYTPICTKPGDKEFFPGIRWKFQCTVLFQAPQNK